MRKTLPAAAPLVLLVIGTFSGCSAAGPAGPAAGQAPPAKAGPVRAGSIRTPSIQTVVLVEVEGEPAETESFASRFLSEISDRGKFRLLDARLSGARLSDLASDPTSTGARSFHESWPGDAYLGITVDRSRIKRHTSTYTDRTPEGYAYERTVVSYEVEGSAALRLVDASDGHMISSFNVQGRTGFTGDDLSAEVSPEQEAAKSTATKAAKKLISVLK